MANKNTTKPQAFIAINGRRIDVSSHLVQDVVLPGTTPVAPAAVTAAPATSLSLKPLSIHRLMDVRPPAPMAQAHRPQHAKTLMRSAVKKPGPLKRIKAVVRTDALTRAMSSVTVVPKISFYHTDPRRVAHARHVPQSNLVHRFSIASPHTEPTAHPDPREAASVRIAAETTAVSTPHHQSMDIFERALANADAHLAQTLKKPNKKKPIHHRTTSIVAASLAILLLTSFVAYQNKTGLSLRYASAKAGFDATLPSYKPAGFSVGRLTYSAGTVSTAFRAGDNRSFTLNEAASDWNSQTVAEQVVASGKPYQTLQAGGRTVFVYNNNDAVWVSGGILYQLESHGSLSTSQVLDVAGST